MAFIDTLDLTKDEKIFYNLLYKKKPWYALWSRNEIR